MAKLRQTIISRIYAALEKTDFSLRDFEVDFEDKDSLAYIRFTPDERYEFKISEKDVAVRNVANFLNPPPPEMKLVTIESPGGYKIKDVFPHDSIDACIGRISVWCQNIAEDLAAPIPVEEELDDFQIEMERKISESTGDKNERFSENEISILKGKLDTLASKFEELERSKRITESELAEVKTEIGKMKGTLPIYPKVTWYKTAGHKFMDVTKRILKTSEGRELLLASAKKLLNLE